MPAEPSSTRQVCSVHQRAQSLNKSPFGIRFADDLLRAGAYQWVAERESGCRPGRSSLAIARRVEHRHRENKKPPPSMAPPKVQSGWAAARKHGGQAGDEVNRVALPLCPSEARPPARWQAITSAGSGRECGDAASGRHSVRRMHGTAHPAAMTTLVSWLGAERPGDAVPCFHGKNSPPCRWDGNEHYLIKTGSFL